MADYKEIYDESGSPMTGVFHEPTGAMIPADPDNTQWQEYQEWLALGNTPDPLYTQTELDEINRQKNIGKILRKIGVFVVRDFQLLLKLWEIGVAKGLWANSDLPAEYRQAAIDMQDQIDQLKALGYEDVLI